MYTLRCSKPCTKVHHGENQTRNNNSVVFEGDVPTLYGTMRSDKNVVSSPRVIQL